jgi:hypothetical protein
VSGWLRVTAPSEIAVYADAFTKLATTAVYEQEARALIKTAIKAIE